MKKLSMLAIALVATSVAFGQAKPKPGATPKAVECAVMKGHDVEVAKATKEKMFADYKGNRYFFCCGGCKPEFNKNPAKYAKAPHIKTPKKG